MIRLTEPIPCPSCGREVIPGEVYWYDADGQPHACEPAQSDGGGADG